MLPVSNHLHLRAGRDWFRLLTYPVLWILLAVLALHIATYSGQIRTEERVESMKVEFRKWWEYGGKTMLTIQGINPDDPDEYNKRLQDWLDQYTSKKFRYQLHMVPNTVQPHQFFTAWLLQPGWVSLLVFLWFYLYAGTWLEERWGRLRNLGVFVVSCAVGNALVYIIAGLLFRKFLDTPFTGASFGVAVAMGALSVTHGRENIPIRLPGTTSFTLYIPALFFVGLWLLTDSLVNWFINPGLYSAIIPVNFLLFPLGVFIGLRMPVRIKSHREIRKEQLQASLERTVDMAEWTRTENRTFLADGFTAAGKREFQAATDLLQKGLNGLLHENPIDDNTIESTVPRMVHPDMLLDIPANQWLEWGNLLAKLNLPKSSIYCLEQNLSMERDERFARMALLLNGAQRLKFNVDPEKGRKILEKVIALKSDDLHAKRASDMLAKYAPVASIAPEK